LTQQRSWAIAPTSSFAVSEWSVIGYDDIEMFAWPKYDLTMIRPPIETIMDAIRRPDCERALPIVSVQLSERTSVRLANAARR